MHTEGRFAARGRVASLLEVGTGFHPELTGEENVYLNGAILGMSRAEIRRKFDDIVAFAEVEKFINTPVKYYSSGMYVRLAFAVAAHLEPEILIIDEVLAVGDAEFQKKCLGKMEGVSKQGRTVLFVSHSMPAVHRLCTRSLLIRKGQLAAHGPTWHVLQAYLNCDSNHTGQWLPSGDNHETPEFAFTGAALRDPSGNLCAAFRGDQPIQVEVRYAVRRRLRECQINLWISNAMDVQVLASADGDAQCLPALPREPGEYRTSVVLPGHLIVPGHYRLSFSAYQPNAKPYGSAIEALAFEISQAGYIGAFDARRPIVSPILTWNTDPV